MMRCVEEKSTRQAAALKWMEAALKICCDYEASMPWSFYILVHLTVMWILKLNVGHMLYNIFYLFFQQGRTLWGACVQVLFHSVCDTSVPK
jgi:hypothetical protein